MFFKKRHKKKEYMQSNKELFLRLEGRKVKYVSLRKSSEPSEIILGKDGVINIIDNKEIVILCKNKTVFRHNLNTLEADELLSLAGINFRYKNEDTGEGETITAYYKYHRK